jgi:hypothetical protein
MTTEVDEEPEIEAAADAGGSEPAEAAEATTQNGGEPRG